MNRCIGVLLVAGISCSSPENERDAPAITPRSAAELAAVSLNDFQKIQWIVGKWLGSGGAYPAFYEEYRVVDDSTIQMRAFPDSTFSAATDSSLIELRGMGRFASEGRIAPTSLLRWRRTVCGSPNRG